MKYHLPLCQEGEANQMSVTLRDSYYIGFSFINQLGSIKRSALSWSRLSKICQGLWLSSTECIKIVTLNGGANSQIFSDNRLWWSHREAKTTL